MSKAIIKEIFLLLFFSFIALFIRGYEFGVGDQTYYLVLIKQRLNPSLYTNDYLFQHRYFHPTIFIDFITFVIRLIGDFQLGIFLIYFLCLYFFYFFIYRIALVLFNDHRIAFVSLFFLIPAIPIGGSSIVTIEKLLTLRAIAGVFLLASIHALFQRRVLLCAILAGVGFLFHPLTILPIFLIFGMLLLTASTTRQTLLMGLVIFILMTLPMIGHFLMLPQGEGFFFHPQWKMIIEQRMPYVFTIKWSIREWILGGVFVLLNVIYLLTTKDGYKKGIIQAILFSALSLFFLSFIGAIFGIRIPLQLQLGRSLYLPAIFAILFLASFIVKLLEKNAVALFLILITLCLVTWWYWPRHYDFPPLQARNDFERVADWVRLYTSSQSVILIPPNRSGFRLWSERAVVSEYKEGAESLYSLNFALEWSRRQKLLDGYGQLSEERFLTLRPLLDFDYILTQEGLSLPIVYQTKEWTLYHLGRIH